MTKIAVDAIGIVNALFRSIDARDAAAVAELLIDDAAMADTMVSAIFDSGYYLQIKYTTVKKQVMFDRQNPLTVEGVPNWFVAMFSLAPPVMTTEVNDGWRIAGELSVQSHPGVAY